MMLNRVHTNGNRKPIFSLKEIKIYRNRIPSTEQLLITIFLASTAFFLYGDFLKFLSPVYSTLPLSTLLILFLLHRDDKLNTIHYALILYQVYVVGLLLFQFASKGLNNGLVNELVRISVPPTFFYFVYVMLKNKASNEIKSHLDFFFRFAFILMIIECIIRLFFLSNFLVIFFFDYYNLKYNSPLYPDSNFAGFNLLVLEGLALYARFYYRERFFKGDLLWINVLIFFTFSRGAIIASFCIIMFYFFRKSNAYVKLTLLFIFSLIMVQLIPFLMKDGSLTTKLDIISYFIIWLDYPIDELLFGIGSGNMLEVFKRESHNLFGLTIELGIFWLLISMSILIWIYFITNHRTIWILFPCLLNGFISLYPVTYSTFLYVALGFIFLQEKSDYFSLLGKRIMLKPNLK